MQQIVLLAGGAGFIGSHLSSILISSGAIVHCFDNLSTGSEENIKQLKKNKNFSFIKGDVTSVEDLNKLKDVPFTHVYHLASQASVTDIMDHPVSAALSNSLGTKNLMDIAKKTQAKFLFTSSSEAYGDPKEHPQKESYWGNVNPVGVRSGYDEGKRFGESLTMAYHREYGLDVKIVRIFNTYGSASSISDSRIVPRFIVQALSNQPLTVHGDGDQTRSFCYVTDLANGIWKMMESNQTGPVNLGNPIELKVVEVAKKIINMTGSQSEITHVARPQDDPSVRQPDISRAKQLLGWEPKVSFEEGLSLTIAYFRGILAGNE